MASLIYLDHNATTPIAPEVLEAMLPWLREGFGNPGSDHPLGRAARAALDRARAQVAALIGATPDEVIFTASATEANNLALIGAARALAERGRHLITSAVDHPSVAAPLGHLAASGWELTVLPVNAEGRVDPADLTAALRPDTVLVSVMHANNEVGTLQPIAELAALARARSAVFHCDAAQSIGKIPVNVDALGVDLLTLAGHKFHAPKGIGALYRRAGIPLAPILFGAGQEGGLRPGTENVPYAVGLGAAAALAAGRLPALTERLTRQRDRLHATLAAAIPGLTLNGHPEARLPNTLSLAFPGVTGRDLLARAPRVAASLGAACHAGATAISGVLGAMGVDPARALGTVRLSLGAETTDAELDAAAAALIAAWRGLTAG
ncbi:cysteine desulfurase family protein [Thiocystis violacea]|uniref:cysteine desulfurase family protein n=1 Tax=Thiocystis violacea TaxID=13725 RepID=UPI001908EF2F|nr:cysteine desulfurase family protein [Thiocystis violacea]MBK1716094.1 cysteine desulfurase NifS [Thiocystis violacea]